MELALFYRLAALHKSNILKVSIYSGSCCCYLIKFVVLLSALGLDLQGVSTGVTNKPDVVNVPSKEVCCTKSIFTIYF